MMAKCVDIISGSQSIFLCLATLSIPCLAERKKEINDENRLYDHRARHLQTQREARSVNTSEQISIKVDSTKASITTFSIIFQAPPGVTDTIQYRSTAAKMASFLNCWLGTIQLKDHWRVANSINCHTLMDFPTSLSSISLFWKMVKCLIDHKWLRKHFLFAIEMMIICYLFFLRKRRYWFDFSLLVSKF